MAKKLFILLTLSLFLAANAFALEFSADTIMTTKQGKMNGKMYFKENKSRMEMQQGNNEMIMIARIDKKVAWNIMPKQKMYMEIPLDMKDKPKVDEKVEGELDRKQIGSETIDGHPTKKYLITYQSGKNKEQMHQWLATDISFPVKSSAIDNSWIQEFRNIKMGRLADSLFELPAGYKKFQMPAGMNTKRR